VFNDKAAGRVGDIAVGDVILEINGESVVDASHADVVKHLRKLWPNPKSLPGNRVRIEGLQTNTNMNGTVGKCLRTIIKHPPKYAVELSTVSKEVVAVEEKNLVVVNEMRTDSFNMVLTAQVPFDLLMARTTAIPKDELRQRQSFSESEEERARMSVLKQNLKMGVITQEEFDRINQINQQSATLLSPAPSKAPVSAEDKIDQLLDKGRAWLKDVMSDKARQRLSVANEQSTAPDVLVDAPMQADLPGEIVTLASPQRTMPLEPSTPRRSNTALLNEVSVTPPTGDKNSKRGSARKKAARRKIIECREKEKGASKAVVDIDPDADKEDDRSTAM